MTTALASSVTTSWDSPSMKMTTSCREMKKDRRPQWSLHVLTRAQEAEAEALASLATANKTLRDAREKQYQVRQSRGCHPQQQGQRDRTNRRQDQKCVTCSGWSTLGFTVPRKARETRREKRDRTGHTACSEFAMAVHAEKSMCASAALETGKALIDCATRSMGLGALDGLARMNVQHHGSFRSPLDRTKKTWYTFAKGKRQQSEGEVAFQGTRSWSIRRHQDQVSEYNRGARSLAGTEFVTKESHY